MARVYAPIDLGDVAQGQGGFVIHGEDAFDAAGYSVASAGDVNGDGFDDLVVGAPGAGAYVVFGQAGGFDAAIDLGAVAAGQGGFVIRGEVAGDRAGVSVASAGDVNGDGFDDLIVGADGASGAYGGRFAGAAYVVFGQAGGFATPIDLANVAAGQGGFVIRGEDDYDFAGGSVASAGDVNGDGFDDLIIGADLADGAPFNQKTYVGSSYVVFGKAGGFDAVVNLREVAFFNQGGIIISGEDAGDGSGGSVASAGDVNGDGVDDLIIGAIGAEFPGKDRVGAAYVVFGQAGGFDTAIDLGAVAAGQGGFVIQGEDNGDRAGVSVASAGDVNGDGFDDLIVGASGKDGAGNAKPEAGAAYVVFGKAEGFGAAIDLGAVAAGQGGFVIYGEDANDTAGRSVASAGDVNGDGFDDLIIGARYADGAGNAKDSGGAAYVVFGKAGGSGARIDLGAVAAGRGGFVIHGEDAGDYAGISVASAGDLNGDGFDDLVVGANRADGAGNAKDRAGDTYVIFGGGFQPGPAFTAGSDDLTGTATAPYVQGGAGNDTLRGGTGAQTLAGGAGDDLLLSNGAGDVLSGGGGADRFAFATSFVHGSAARILDFDRAEGDSIRLQRIDADRTNPGNDAFTAIGMAAFSGTAGELRWEDLGRGLQRIEADVTGDGLADGAILLVDAAPIEAGWFVL